MTQSEEPLPDNDTDTLIPLTIEQLKQGLDEATLDRLRSALNMKPLYEIIAQLAAEAPSQVETDLAA